MRKPLVVLVSMGLFFPSLIWLILELDWIENVVGGRWFVLLVLAAAALPAWWAARAIRRFADPWPEVGPYARLDAGAAHRAREAGAAGLMAFLGVLALALSAASHVNHARAGRIDAVAVTVIARGHHDVRARSPEEWRLTVRVQGRREDVVVSPAEWARSAPGARLSMQRMHGALGFSVLYTESLRRRCRGRPG